MSKIFRIKGFAPQTGDDSGNEQNQDFFDQQTSEKSKQVKQFISARYNPVGTPEEKEFRSTLELRYELQEMISVFESTINQVMNEMGFQIADIDDKPNWVLYRSRKDPPD
jgi:hypothetical protein